MEILFEENKIFFNIDYNGKNIYEWNFDIYSDYQIYIIAYRMLMYSTICRHNGNTDEKQSCLPNLWLYWHFKELVG